jgi:hypothetical protein
LPSTLVGYLNSVRAYVDICWGWLRGDKFANFRKNLLVVHQKSFNQSGWMNELWLHLTSYFVFPTAESPRSIIFTEPGTWSPTCSISLQFRSIPIRVKFSSEMSGLKMEGSLYTILLLWCQWHNTN